MGDIAQRILRKNKSGECTLPLTISAQYGLVEQEAFFNKRIASKDLSNYIVVKAGEFAYNKSYSEGYPWGAIKRLDRYPSGVVSSLYIVFSIRKERINSDFLQILFESDVWHKEVNKVAAEGARNHGLLNITSDDFFRIQLYLPVSQEEQFQIGSFFSELNNLITLHQRKLDNLKKLKSGLLQKMRLTVETTLTDVFWPLFAIDWEQRKLGDFSHKVTRKNESDSVAETFTNSAERGIVSQTEFFDKEISNPENTRGYYVVKNNDFVYNPRISNLAPCGPVGRNKLNRSGIMSPLYTVFSVKGVDYSFLEFFFKSDHWHLFMYLNGDTGARADRFAIKDKVFFDMPITVPKIHDEQKMIGDFLTDFDLFITLHQRT